MGKRLRIEGRENVEKNKNYLLLANHTSIFDIMAIMAANPGVSWFGREYLTKIPVFGYFLKVINYIPMKTTNFRNTKIMLDQLVEHSKGFTLAIFPEGTRTTDGKVHEFKRGFIHVLRSSNLDVLPVSLIGLYELKPKTRFYINFDSKVEVVIHKPIPNNELIHMEDKLLIEKVKKIIEKGC